MGSGLNHIIQLLVSRRGLDPVAWTALHALGGLELPATPRALARAELWEFGLPSGADPERLVRWAVSANWFANPSRDRVRWRLSSGDPAALSESAVRADGGVGMKGDGAYLSVTWIDGLEAPAHEKAVRRHLELEIAVRRGHVWWLGVDGNSAADCLRILADEAAGGLLANPHSQRCQIHADGLPLPTLFVSAVESRPAEGARGTS